MSYRGANVLITGGLGFIGSNLARRLLADGATLTLVDSMYPGSGANPFNIHDIASRVAVEPVDVRNAPAMASLLAGKDFLFNIAGQTSHLDSMRDPQVDLDINCAAQLSIVESCRRVNPGIKIVFTSTRQVYGRPDQLPVAETHPIRPPDVNAINKFGGEWYHLLYNNVYSVRSTVLRLTNTYGPAMRIEDARQTFVGIWIRQLLAGRPLRVFGDGMQRRDFTFVADCVDALMAAGASEAANGQVFNVGTRDSISLSDLASLMIDVAGGGTSELVPFPADRKAIDIGDYATDTTLIEQTLGWKPVHDLRGGMAITIDYFRQNLDMYVSYR